MSPLIFVHGWAMAPTIWQEVQTRLANHTAKPSWQNADLGFFGHPAKPEVKEPLVIAHSLGLMWALDNLPRPWSGAVIVNGFTRFSRTDSVPGIEPRLLARMQSRLDDDPETVVRDFLVRCGQEAPITQGLDRPALNTGMEWLREGDKRREFDALRCPVLAVAGTHDPIVTPDHSRACFNGFPTVWMEGGGHLLPLTHAPWLADRIAALVKGDWSA